MLTCPHRLELQKQPQVTESTLPTMQKLSCNCLFEGPVTSHNGNRFCQCLPKDSWTTCKQENACCYPNKTQGRAADNDGCSDFADCGISTTKCLAPPQDALIPWLEGSVSLISIPSIWKSLYTIAFLKSLAHQRDWQSLALLFIFPTALHLGVKYSILFKTSFSTSSWSSAAAGKTTAASYSVCKIEQ